MPTEIMLTEIKQAFTTATKTLDEFCRNSSNFALIDSIAKELTQSFKHQRKVLICGNGGSNCDAMHFAEEFTGRFRKNRQALPAIALSDSAHITCVGNDYGFEHIFARGVEAFGLPGDWFIGLSTSGNSANIINALRTAKALGLRTVGLLGKDGGKLLGQFDFEFVIPGKTSDRIQELHMLILHVLIEAVERYLFPENYLSKSLTASAL